MSHELKVNGVVKQYDASNMPRTISDLLEQMNISQATVVAELDGDIIQRRDFANTQIQPGQTIELVRFVGGG